MSNEYKFSYLSEGRFYLSACDILTPAKPFKLIKPNLRKSRYILGWKFIKVKEFETTQNISKLYGVGKLLFYKKAEDWN